MNTFYHDFSAFSTEHEDDYLELGEKFITNRKNSFIDLLSHETTYLNYNNDLLNLDSELDNVILQTSSNVSNLIVLPSNPVPAPQQPANEDKINLVKDSKIKSDPISSPFKLIGTLSQSQRALKVRKYLMKKQKRVWSKRVHYDCRKRVAQNRLRVKGRFVTKSSS